MLSEFLPTIVSDKVLSEVARQIGSCWRSVAFELNLSRAEVLRVERVAADEEESAAEDENVQYARGMLVYWRQTSGRYATRTILAHALRNCDLPNAMEVANERSCKRFLLFLL